ncbi:MAG TPA: hypothetical protein PKN32_04255 [Bacteroidales bacterium]|nr:hypothetical protein [Bacteroidales bacterium]
MVINTKEIASRIKLGTMLLTLVYAGLLVAALVFAWSPKHYFEIILSILYLFFLAFIFVKNYSYIFYNSDGLKIIMRYTSLQPLSAGNYSIEIPKRDFVKAEIVNSHIGLRKNLIFYVKTPQGIAKFKPVSLSILNKSQVSGIMDELNSL